MENKKAYREQEQRFRGQKIWKKTTNACQSKVDMSTQQKDIVETHEK